MTKTKKKATVTETVVGFIIMIGIFSWLSGPAPKKLTPAEKKVKIERAAKAKKSRLAELLRKEKEMAKGEAIRAKARAKFKRNFPRLSATKRIEWIKNKYAQSLENTCMSAKRRLVKKYRINEDWISTKSVRLWAIPTFKKNREGLFFYKSTFTGKNVFGVKASWTIKCKWSVRKLTMNPKFSFESAKL